MANNNCTDPSNAAGFFPEAAEIASSDHTDAPSLSDRATPPACAVPETQTHTGLTRESSEDPREARIVQAKRRIAMGAYKDRRIVERVAQRIADLSP